MAKKNPPGNGGFLDGSFDMLDMPEPNKKPTDPQILRAVDTPEKVPVSVADWFHKSVLRSRLGIFSEVVSLTPDHARLMLAANDGNRRVIGTHVARMASDMKAGLWSLNGESIKIARDGRLVDGQNRLHAVIDANTPIKTVVTFGIDFDSRMTTDQGVAKTVGDYLSMEGGVVNASLCAAVARMLLGHRLGLRTDTLVGGKSRKILTKVRIRQEYFDNQRDIDTAVHFVAGREVSKALGGKSVIATAMVIMGRQGRHHAEEFITRYASGADLEQGSPILAARDRMIREPGMRMDDRIKLLLKAFDAWLDGRKVTRLMVKERSDKGKKK